MRDRKLFVPIIHAPIGCDRRIGHLGAMVTGVYEAISECLLCDLSDSEKAKVSDATLLSFFFKQYAKALLIVKRSRHKKHSAYTYRDHEETMRASVYDRLYRYFKEATDVYESRFINEDQFYEKLCAFAIFTGMIHSELRHLAAGYLNNVSIICEQRSARKKGADIRHIEHRSMKAEVFTWLDSHTPEFTVIEAAARAIVKQQPITHVTARDWFKEWKKLRSASTP